MNNTTKFQRIVIILLIISLVTENIRIISILGGDIKLPHIACILGIVIVLSKKIIIKFNYFVMFILFSMLPILPLYRISDKLEWIKTYVNYVLILLFLIFALPPLIKKFNDNYKRFYTLIIYIIVSIQLLAIVQFILMNYFDYFFLKDVFGIFQFHKSSFGMQNGYYRAYSVFHEPSVLGWVCTSSVAFLLFNGELTFSNKKIWGFQILNIITILLTVSASALCILMSIIVINLLIKKISSIKFWIIGLGLTLSLVLLNIFTNVLEPLSRISNELFTENTSGYERINVPLQYMAQTLKYYPFLGRGIGQEGWGDKVGVIGNYSAINNSIIGVVVNFGLSSILIYLTAFNLLYEKIKTNRKWWILSINLFGIYLSTGAYISLDIFVYLVITIFVGSCKIDINLNNLDRHSIENKV